MDVAVEAPATISITGWAYRVTAPYRFERTVEQVRTRLAEGEVLVELTAGAVCGSDLPVARGAILPPAHDAVGRPLHEVVGIVVSSRHEDFSEGDRVVGWAAKEDALRQYFITPGERISRVRLTLSDPLATTAQSVACLMTLFERLGDLSDKSVGIIGLGPFGLMAGTIAHARGATRIVGIDPLDRAADASALPFTEVRAANSRTWAETIADSERPDVVLEMVGHQTSTLADAMRAVGAGGIVASFGVPDDDSYAVPFKEFFRRNGTLISGVTTQHRAMLEMAQDYLLENPWFARYFVTDVFSSLEVEDAFLAACQPKPGQRKVVIDFRKP